ncbi:MAG TPA: aldose epimerase family protein [Terriglobales bacterium]|nr:aldose epimerase family protein [Terriglobales bacterium]
MKILILVAFFLMVSLVTAAAQPQKWGTVDGKDVYLYTLRNQQGMEVTITNFGGRIVSLKVPDRSGKFADVVLGFDSLQGYLGDNDHNPYFGAIVGRYANRIAKGKFQLDGHTYKLPINNPPNSLHGGNKGFDRRVWSAAETSGASGQHLRLHYVSKDGEEGYPGNLDVTVVYTLPADKNELRIEYSATTDKDTVLNLSNHSYFNLAGQGEGDILGHEVTIEAGRFTPVDSTLIPTGELKPVAGTPFDFQKPHAIGERINSADEQLKFGRGYDHNFVLNGTGMRLAARVKDPKSGRVLEVLTDQPGLQFYTGNFLDGTIKGKGGKVYVHRGAFCLETQHYPDSPNHAKFPTTELKPGQKFHSETIFRFSVEK